MGFTACASRIADEQAVFTLLQYGKVQSYSQGAQLAHVSKDEHAVAASGRIVYCENALTAAEMATEGAWEEWLNSQYRHHDAATGAWPILTAH